MPKSTLIVLLEQQDEYDWVLHGTLPDGVIVDVRDYRLAEGAEPGTTVFDEVGKPYFQWSFKGTGNCDHET